MPAARPRMQVTATERSYLLLKELSAITGKAPATIVREILDESAPALEMSIEAFKAIQDRPQEAQAAVLRFVTQAQGFISQASLPLSTDKKPGRKPSKKDPGADEPR